MNKTHTTLENNNIIGCINIHSLCVYLHFLILKPTYDKLITCIAYIDIWFLPFVPFGGSNSWHSAIKNKDCMVFSLALTLNVQF